MWTLKIKNLEMKSDVTINPSTKFLERSDKYISINTPHLENTFCFSTEQIGKAFYIRVSKNLGSNIEINFDRNFANITEEEVICGVAGWLKWLFTETNIEKVVAKIDYDDFWERHIFYSTDFSDDEEAESRGTFFLEKHTWKKLRT